ncbi:MAG: patatin-like phospholipase family protein [Bacillota bacterium]
MHVHGAAEREVGRHTEGAEPMRLVLVLSGAVALGTFEAGVVYELLRAVRAGAPLTVDVIAGASAGSLVGAAAAKCLVSGVPFEQILPRWTEYTLQELATGYETVDEARRARKMLDRGILSSRAVRRIVEENLVADPVHRDFQPAYPSPRLCLTMTITNIDGLPLLSGETEERQFTEAVTFRFTPPNPHRLDQSPYPPAIWQRVGRIAQASAAFPGAFDPLTVPWAERIWIPGQLEEIWENDALLERLHRADPGIQRKMLYADGGILDNQPAERAIADLALVTGGRGEPGLEALVYDPRRCVLFIEPEPPSSTPEAIRTGRRRTWWDLFTRSVHLWTLASSPYIGRPRVSYSNTKLVRLFRFLAELGWQIASEPQAPSSGELLNRIDRRHPDWEVLRRAGATLADGEAPIGLINPDLFGQAVRRFYRWLVSDRFERDLEWVDRLPPGRVREAHQSILRAITDLREAYLGLWGADPEAPGAHQEALEEIHVNLAVSLGLTQPWVGLSEITPEDPRMLRGEDLHNFGGFFSEEFLRHDYEVGRYYAYRWLREAIPEYAAEDPPVLPPMSDSGLNWRHLWQNRGPLWRMTGRLVAVILEAAGLNYAGGGQMVVKLLGWSLLLSILHGISMLVGAWFGWIVIPQEYEHLRFWLLMGTSLFPLVVGFFLGLTFRRR